MTTARTRQTKKHGADRRRCRSFFPRPKKTSSGGACHCLGSGSITRTCERQSCCKRAPIAENKKRAWRSAVRTACTAECFCDKKLRSLTWPQQRPGLSRTPIKTLCRVLCTWQMAIEFRQMTSASHVAILGHRFLSVQLLWPLPQLQRLGLGWRTKAIEPWFLPSANGRAACRQWRQCHVCPMQRVHTVGLTHIGHATDRHTPRLSWESRLRLVANCQAKHTSLCNPIRC